MMDDDSSKLILSNYVGTKAYEVSSEEVESPPTTKYVSMVSTVPKNKKKSKTQINKETSEIKKKTRLVTDTNYWQTNVTNKKIDLNDTKIQWSCLINTVEYPIIERQILNKIRGYKSQDMDKGIYQEEEFVTYEYVYALIQEYKMECYYCKECTMILYECVREPKQWTLERIDNTKGHNCGNVQIACLQCNLRRRTMFQEKYVLTKQMMNVTKLLR
jgi:hypothetical protein